jgi:hypothetical protein
MCPLLHEWADVSCIYIDSQQCEVLIRPDETLRLYEDKQLSDHSLNNL